MKHNQGSWKKSSESNCNRYEGEYKEDKKHGYG
jgi:hypothetical protein